MASHKGKSLGKGVRNVLCHILCFLVSASNFDTVVRSVSLHELGCSRCFVKLLLQFFFGHAVDLDWNRVLLVSVELIAELLWKHFVDSQVSEESIVLLTKGSLVLELVVVALKLIEADHLSDARDV
jgi:hypothetical protein